MGRERWEQVESGSDLGLVLVRVGMWERRWMGEGGGQEDAQGVPSVEKRLFMCAVLSELNVREFALQYKFRVWTYCTQS